jgi:hypothetical protein
MFVRCRVDYLLVQLDGSSFLFTIVLEHLSHRPTQEHVPLPCCWFSSEMNDRLRNCFSVYHPLDRNPIETLTPGRQTGEWRDGNPFCRWNRTQAEGSSACPVTRECCSRDYAKPVVPLPSHCSVMASAGVKQLRPAHCPSLTDRVPGRRRFFFFANLGVTDGARACSRTT